MPSFSAMLTRLIQFLAAPLLLAGCATVSRPAPAPARYDRGMVSAADPRAAAAGVAMLRAGGTATDAALAVMLALTVVEPQSSGIGGGGFYVSSDPMGRVDTIDGRERAPYAARPDWFLVDGKPRSFGDAQPGGLSTGVPGTIALADHAHKLHGRLAWKALFAPAIRLAEQGFSITPRMFGMLKAAPATGAYGAGRALFYDAVGAPLPVGTTVHNPALAAFFKRLASEGPDAFYMGSNAAAIVQQVSHAAHNPAPMAATDLAAMTAPERPAVCGTYRLYRICGMGPPSSGATTLLAMLGQLERFDLAATGKDSPTSWHLIAESMRLAYADRGRYLADSDFVKVPVAGLIDPGYLATRSALIDPATSLAKPEPGLPPGAPLTLASPPPALEHGTSHFVAVDRAGNAVSYTSTIESPFGSGIVVNGYYLNNELTDFDMMPAVEGKAVANRVEGGKRPRSSMAPTMVYDPQGHLRLVVGAAGGATIPPQVLRVIIGVIDWHLSAQQAIALPVLFAPGGDLLFVEPGSALEAMIPALTALGHTGAVARTLPLKANAIEVIDGHLVGAADPRSEGVALGE